MSRLVLSIDLEGEAFKHGRYPGRGVVHTLIRYINNVKEHGTIEWSLVDENGNDVGKAEVQ